MPQLDVSTYISQLFWLVICFFSLYFIMAKLIIPRIADIIDQRHKKIDDYLDKAMSIEKQAEESLQKYQDALEKATNEANQAIEKTQQELNDLIKNKQDELDASLKAKLLKSDAAMEKNKEQALQQIQNISEALALNIVQKMGLNDINSNKIHAASKKMEQ